MKRNLESATIAEEFSQKIAEQNKKDKIIRMAPVIILVFLLLVFSFTVQGFFTAFNFVSLLRQASILLILAMGITFVIVMGGIDLSVDGVMGLTASVISLLVLNNITTFDLGILGVLIVICIGAFMGFISGLIHVKLKLPSFIVTFGMSSVATGIALLAYKGIPATIQDRPMQDVLESVFLGIPSITWISLLIFVVAYIIQEFTGLGRYIFAIGDNENTLKVSGINIDRVKILAFSWAGLCTGIAGIIGAFRYGRGEILVGKGMVFPVITAVVVGGTSLSGGKGGVVNSLVGVLIVTVLQNALILLGVNPYIQYAIQGIIIVAAVSLSVTRNRKIITK